MSYSSHGDGRRSPISRTARMVLLVGGFFLLGAAFALVLFGSGYLDTGEPEVDTAGNDAAVESIELGTPIIVAPPANFGPAPRPGEAAPAFILDDIYGEEITLNQFRGQPVILNFWATWCGPCIFEMPELEAAYQAHRDDGLVVLGLNRDEDNATIGDFLANDLDVSLSFPLLLDEHALVADRYGVNNLPTTYFVDVDGLVSAVHHGPLTLEQIELFLAEMS